MALDTSTMASLVTRLKNIVGDRTADVLEKSFGMTTVNELLRHYPRRYVVRGELTDISTLLADDEVTILAEIEAVKLRRANGKNILEVIVTDGSANLSLTFFNQAQMAMMLMRQLQSLLANFYLSIQLLQNCLPGR